MLSFDSPFPPPSLLHSAANALHLAAVLYSAMSASLLQPEIHMPCRGHSFLRFIKTTLALIDFYSCMDLFYELLRMKKKSSVMAAGCGAVLASFLDVYWCNKRKSERLTVVGSGDV